MMIMTLTLCLRPLTRGAGALRAQRTKPSCGAPSTPIAPSTSTCDIPSASTPLAARARRPSGACVLRAELNRHDRVPDATQASNVGRRSVATALLGQLAQATQKPSALVVTAQGLGSLNRHRQHRKQSSALWQALLSRGVPCGRHCSESRAVPCGRHCSARTAQTAQARGRQGSSMQLSLMNQAAS